MADSNKTEQPTGKRLLKARQEGQFATSRGVRHSPLHDALAARGAYFGEVAGWERPHWFLPGGEAAGGPRSHDTWSRPRWHAHVAAEHMAVRTGVGLFDLSHTFDDPQR